MPAVAVEGHAENGIGVRVFERLDRFPRPAVPDLDGPVPERGGEELAVRAKRQAVDFGLVPEDQRLDPAEPHEVVPLPAAQVLRALPEELEGAAQVVHGQLAVGQGNAVEIEGILQSSLAWVSAWRFCRRPLLARD